MERIWWAKGQLACTEPKSKHFLIWCRFVFGRRSVCRNCLQWHKANEYWQIFTSYGHWVCGHWILVRSTHSTNCNTDHGIYSVALGTQCSTALCVVSMKGLNWSDTLSILSTQIAVIKLHRSHTFGPSRDLISIHNNLLAKPMRSFECKPLLHAHRMRRMCGAEVLFSEEIRSEIEKSRKLCWESEKGEQYEHRKLQ